MITQLPAHKCWYTELSRTAHNYEDGLLVLFVPLHSDKYTCKPQYYAEPLPVG